jgi:hypothetical protein
MTWIWEHDWWNLGPVGRVLFDQGAWFGALVLGWMGRGWHDRRKARKRSEVRS